MQALTCLADPKCSRRQMAQVSACSQVPKPYLAKVLKKLTDAGLVHLEGLTNLKYLDLRANYGISNAGAEKLRAALPDCYWEHYSGQSHWEPEAR